MVHWARARDRKGHPLKATDLLKELPELPTPWNVDTLCARLAARRGRPLLVHDLAIPALPTGLWYDDGERDHIVCRAGLSGYYRDHVILHEICHMLAGHNAGTSPVPRATEYTAQQEELAETFAAKVLKRARPAVSGFEQRSALVFGI